MNYEKQSRGDSAQPETIMFGFDRNTDEASLAAFLKKIAAPAMLEEIIPRLEEQEIEAVVELFMGLMKKHLSRKEFHRLFLADNK